LRRSKPYTVRLTTQREPHTLAAYLWAHYVRQGWLRATSRRRAELAPGIIGYLEDGTLRLVDTARRIGVSIPSSWRLVERAALYSLQGAQLTPEQMQRAVQEQYAIR
jgi:hypothetical protein